MQEGEERKRGEGVEKEKSCLTCEKWQPRKNPAMAKHRMARCELKPAWQFFPPQHSCQRHKPVADDIAAARIAWESK